jgi:hypothetical protein
LSGVASCWHSNAYFSLFSSLFFFDPPNSFVQIPRHRAGEAPGGIELEGSGAARRKGQVGVRCTEQLHIRIAVDGEAADAGSGGAGILGIDLQTEISRDAG